MTLWTFHLLICLLLAATATILARHTQSVSPRSAPGDWLRASHAIRRIATPFTRGACPQPKPLPAQLARCAVGCRPHPLGDGSPNPSSFYLQVKSGRLNVEVHSGWHAFHCVPPKPYHFVIPALSARSADKQLGTALVLRAPLDGRGPKLLSALPRAEAGMTSELLKRTGAAEAGMMLVGASRREVASALSSSRSGASAQRRARL